MCGNAIRWLVPEIRSEWPEKATTQNEAILESNGPLRPSVGFERGIRKDLCLERAEQKKKKKKKRKKKKEKKEEGKKQNRSFVRLSVRPSIGPHLFIFASSSGRSVARSVVSAGSAVRLKRQPPVPQGSVYLSSHTHA